MIGNRKFDYPEKVTEPVTARMSLFRTIEAFFLIIVTLLICLALLFQKALGIEVGKELNVLATVSLSAMVLFSTFCLLVMLRQLTLHRSRLFTIYPYGIEFHQGWTRQALGKRLHWSEVKSVRLHHHRIFWDRVSFFFALGFYNKRRHAIFICLGLPQPHYWQDLIQETKEAYLGAQKAFA